MAKEKSIFAQNIIRRRRALGFSQLKLAEAADLSISYIKQIETDVTDGSGETRAKLARALGCTKEDLYEKPPAAPPTGLAALGQPGHRLEPPPPMFTKEQVEAIAMKAAVAAAKEVASDQAAELTRLRAENESLKRRLAAAQKEEQHKPPMIVVPAMSEDEADAELSQLESEALGSGEKPAPGKA